MFEMSYCSAKLDLEPLHVHPAGALISILDCNAQAKWSHTSTKGSLKGAPFRALLLLQKGS